MADNEDVLKGVAIFRAQGGHLSSKAMYVPIYQIENTKDYCMIDDVAFTANTEEEAARIAHKRRVDTGYSSLVWTGRVARVSVKGVHCVKGKLGAFPILCYKGPSYDNARQQDDVQADINRKSGLPTMTPGDRTHTYESRKQYRINSGLPLRSWAPGVPDVD